MSLASLENAIVRELRGILNNRRLTKNSIREWCTSEEKVSKNLEGDEAMVRCPGMGVWVAFKKTDDKRERGA